MCAKNKKQNNKLLIGRYRAKLRPGTLFIGTVTYNANFNTPITSIKNTVNLSDR